jgi:hypothetical protein
MSYPPGPPDHGDPTPDEHDAAAGDQPAPDEQQPGPPPGYGQPGYGQPGSGQPGYGGYPQQYGYGPPPATNGKATAALITGISSLVLFWCCGLGIAGVAAIVLGIKARNEISAAGGAQSGDGMALGGIITGAIAVVLGLLALAFVIYTIASGNADYNIDYGDDSNSF